VYKLWSSSLCSLLQPPATSSLLGPNILLSTLCPNIFSLCYPFNVRNSVSHPYKTTGKFVVPYILTFRFLDRSREGNGWKQNGSKHSQNLICCLFLRGCNFHTHTSKLCHSFKGFLENFA
jgi:hypothetical protein